MISRSDMCTDCSMSNCHRPGAPVCLCGCHDPEYEDSDDNKFEDEFGRPLKENE